MKAYTCSFFSADSACIHCTCVPLPQDVQVPVVKNTGHSDTVRIIFSSNLLYWNFIVFSDLSKDPIARKMRLRRGRRDQEEADQDQAKILKVSSSTFCLSVYLYFYKML
jgi:hypothetical protein